jgi:epoxyqueuosine reductase
MTARYGAWVALQAVVTDAELPASEPEGSYPTCDDCCDCLSNCPTGALYEPGKLDPRLCIAYNLTLVDMPSEFWDKTGGYILGCDECIVACPHNRKAALCENVESLFPNQYADNPDLSDTLSLSEKKFQQELISYIMAKLPTSRTARFLSRHPRLAKTLKSLLSAKYGQEVVPETFIHASGNLLVYKRNAILALAQTKDPAALPLLSGFENHPYLAPYVKWARSILE